MQRPPAEANFSDKHGEVSRWATSTIGTEWPIDIQLVGEQGN
jgi:hypothetical protein